jgi:phosphatidylserine decarboxylase
MITFVRWGIIPFLLVTAVQAWGIMLLPDGPARWVGIGIAILVELFIINFFRNPLRKPQGGPHSLISSADGMVQDITEVDEPEFIGGKALRIGVFLSVFDVHVNRAPCPGTITFAKYTAGNFLDVRHPDVSTENESNVIGIVADDSVQPGLKLLVRQLTGLIARRIICTHGVGDRVERGELYGMIRFGSRTELWIPMSAAFDVKVKVGDRVKCGETVLVEMKTGENKA